MVMTRLEKVEKVATLFMALMGFVLSTILFVQDWKNSKPTLYSSYSILPESAEPKADKMSKVRMEVSIANTGKEEVEIPPIISITIFDTVTREERQINASLLNDKRESMSHIIPTTLKQGDTRVYRTSYEDIRYFWGPYVTTVVQMWSGDDLFVAPSEPSNNPDGIKAILDNDIVSKHFDNIKSYPSKFLKISDLR